MAWTKKKEWGFCFALSCVHLIPDLSKGITSDLLKLSKVTWKGWLQTIPDQRLSLSYLSVCNTSVQRLCFLISYEGFTELSNYTCQVLFKKVMFSTTLFFIPSKKKPNLGCLNDSVARNCGKRKNESDWTGIEVSRRKRWIPVLSVESCHNSPQQLFWEQLGVAGNMSHTPPLLCAGPGRNPTLLCHISISLWWKTPSGERERSTEEPGHRGKIL